MTHTSRKAKKRTLLFREQSGICALCDQPLPPLDAPIDKRLRPTLDHITPRSKQGTNQISNLQLTHAICNERRSSMPVHEARAILGGDA